MSYSVISFDLQGTLSDSAFSDEFWLKLLPELYAKQMELPLEEAKAKLKKHFKEMGKYNRLYYCGRSWMAQLYSGRSVADAAFELEHAPHLYQDTLNLVQELEASSKTMIILSTTTHDFIDLELGEARKHFAQVFSTLDDFNMPGKPADAFREAARRMNVETSDIIHIGDCSEMDIANAKEAGCQTFFFDKSQPRDVVLEQLRQALGM